MLKKFISLSLLSFSSCALALVNFTTPMSSANFAKVFGVSEDQAKTLEQSMTKMLTLAGVSNVTKVQCDYSKAKLEPMIFCGVREYSQTAGSSKDVTNQTKTIAVSIEKVGNQYVLVTEGYLNIVQVYPKQVITLQ